MFTLRQKFIHLIASSKDSDFSIQIYLIMENLVLNNIDILYNNTDIYIFVDIFDLEATFYICALKLDTKL